MESLYCCCIFSLLPFGKCKIGHDPCYHRDDDRSVALDCMWYLEHSLPSLSDSDEKQNEVLDAAIRFLEAPPGKSLDAHKSFIMILNEILDIKEDRFKFK